MRLLCASCQATYVIPERALEGDGPAFGKCPRCGHLQALLQGSPDAKGPKARTSTVELAPPKDVEEAAASVRPSLGRLAPARASGSFRSVPSGRAGGARMSGPLAAYAEPGRELQALVGEAERPSRNALTPAPGPELRRLGYSSGAGPLLAPGLGLQRSPELEPSPTWAAPAHASAFEPGGARQTVELPKSDAAEALLSVGARACVGCGRPLEDLFDLSLGRCVQCSPPRVAPGSPGEKTEEFDFVPQALPDGVDAKRGAGGRGGDPTSQRPGPKRRLLWWMGWTLAAGGLGIAGWWCVSVFLGDGGAR